MSWESILTVRRFHTIFDVPSFEPTVLKYPAENPPVNAPCSRFRPLSSRTCMSVSRSRGPLAYLLFPERNVSAVIADFGVKGRQRRAKENKWIVLWVWRPLPLPRIECHRRPSPGGKESAADRLCYLKKSERSIYPSRSSGGRNNLKP